MIEQIAMSVSHIAHELDQTTYEARQTRFDAMRHCDEWGIKDPEAQRQVIEAMTERAFRNAIRPMLKIKIDIAAMQIPSYLFRSDDWLECATQTLTPAEQRLWDQVDEMIASEAKRYGVTLTPLP